MGDVWNIHNLWLMYGTYVSNGRHMEHSCFTVDIQDMPAPHINYLSATGINFPTPSPTTKQ